MIGEFIASWDLFAATYLAGWLIAALLAAVGVWVVAREQIFLGAAVGQASALGIALGLWLSGTDALHGLHEHGTPDALLSGLAVLAAIGATLLTAMGGDRLGSGGRESPEAITGWVFLVGMSGSVLLVAFSPHGTDHIQRLLASTLIGATMGDVWLFAGLLAGVALLLLVAHRTLILLAMDPEMAAALGVRVWRWNLAACAGLGLCIGLSMRVSGLLYTFGCLVLPALACRQVCRRTSTIFLLAPVAAVICAAAGFILANHYDLPPAQVTVALLAGLLLLAWIGRRWVGR